MMDNYAKEVRERWGDTDAYCEHEQKTKNYTKEKWTEANDGLMAIFAEFAECRACGADAASKAAQALVAKLQAYITAHYYTCTARTRYRVALGYGHLPLRNVECDISVLAGQPHVTAADRAICTLWMDGDSAEIESVVVPVRPMDGAWICEFSSAIAIQINIASIKAHKILVAAAHESSAGERAAGHLENAARKTPPPIPVLAGGRFAVLTAQRSIQVNHIIGARTLNGQRPPVKIIERTSIASRTAAVHVKRLKRNIAAGLPELVWQCVAGGTRPQSCGAERRTIFKKHTVLVCAV